MRLVGPRGWRGTEAALDAGPRAEVVADLEILAAERCRRQAVAVDLEVDGQPYGQVAEALVTVGQSYF